MPIYQRFSPSEDKKLINLVNIYGDNNWKAIAEKMKNRSVRQVKERYTLFLSPKINTNIWTDEEDELLIKLVKEHESHWIYISSYFHGRNDVQIKNRYRKLMKKKHRTQDVNNVLNIEKKPPQSSQNIAPVDSNKQAVNCILDHGEQDSRSSILSRNIEENGILDYFFNCDMFNCPDLWDQITF
ncbi:Myb-like DNA-binding domain containing protein [Trichomonas vaginalis G3]|uniref:Myb-like DNA-binding domain containing protein n=1 Tax=Trichomonas vaginalis (strain ATCC PRA-98 / G3) TaxID=412133 RepID=A2G7C9_TRIV3|nr:RNA polymerase II transcription regulator recruiting protein [Trichomonas vaginalis G3]EAX86935.1 Myb-like DNA-binding domain containing protein [Trichomonas vaginalis G3]KAI5510697.1 RNA polymerase II transcription regulator recruiting protein [Trichomonas vaginalis G3]|eukprot:XP_001299865.1 Myb-like DNA-binding domain containing protein [Trichomonas vaginalis G3]